MFLTFWFDTNFQSETNKDDILESNVVSGRMSADLSKSM